MTDDYLSRLDDMLGDSSSEDLLRKPIYKESSTTSKPSMLGEQSVAGVAERVISAGSTPNHVGSTQSDSKPSTHPLWKLIDKWGGQMYLKCSQLTLWGVQDE